MQFRISAIFFPNFRKSANRNGLFPLSARVLKKYTIPIPQKRWLISEICTQNSPFPLSANPPPSGINVIFTLNMLHEKSDWLIYWKNHCYKWSEIQINYHSFLFEDLNFFNPATKKSKKTTLKTTNPYWPWRSLICWNNEALPTVSKLTMDIQMLNRAMIWQRKPTELGKCSQK